MMPPAYALPTTLDVDCASCALPPANYVVVPPVNALPSTQVRSGHSLLEAMQAYVTLWKADLVVVPSACLARTEPQALLGSVALAILKRMEVGRWVRV